MRLLLPITKALGKSPWALDLLGKPEPSEIGFSYLKRISILVWGEEFLTLPPPGVLVTTFCYEASLLELAGTVSLGVACFCDLNSPGSRIVATRKMPQFFLPGQGLPGYGTLWFISQRFWCKMKGWLSSSLIHRSALRLEWNGVGLKGINGVQ